MLLAQAIENNLSLYASVLRAHDIAWAVDTHCGWTPSRVPPYYSNLVTRTSGTPAVLLDRIRSLAVEPPWAFKDSFGCVDPGQGWRVLLAAHWYGCEQGDLGAPEAVTSFDRVASAAELESWEVGWQVHSPTPGVRVFPSAALAEPALEIFTLPGRGGAILNRSPGAVGISNVFPDDAALHRDVACFARRRHPTRAIVGYGAHEDLLPIGFAALGPLRVWLREA